MEIGAVKRPALILSLIILLLASAVQAQLSAPNNMGVAMGHLHYFVRDVEANKEFWIELGATPIKVGTTDVMKFADILIFLSSGESSGGTEDSVVNHVAFRVSSGAETFPKLEAAGIKVVLSRTRGLEGGNVFTPEGERIEIFQQGIENVAFYPADLMAGVSPNETLGRLSGEMPVPIMPHHIHLYVPEGAVAEAKAWYVRMFGAEPGRRWNYEAADLPGINLNFSERPTTMAPTQGRMLDHIGFEVRNLAAFCQKLEAKGVEFDMPYTKFPTGVASAFLTDPWGTYIELTEGLDRY
jgi:catechol 2,3-dioxygenase-like lactoylglutathione lyase family enzyme